MRECVPSYCAVDDAFSDSRLIAAEAAASPRRLLVLLGMKLSITLSQGWPRGWFGGCLVTNIVPIPVNLPHTFQPLSLARSGRCSLSKCHSVRTRAWNLLGGLRCRSCNSAPIPTSHQRVNGSGTRFLSRFRRSRSSRNGGNPLHRRGHNLYANHDHVRRGAIFLSATRSYGTGLAWAANRVGSMLLPLVILPFFVSHGASVVAVTAAMAMLLASVLAVVGPKGAAGADVS